MNIFFIWFSFNNFLWVVQKAQIRTRPIRSNFTPHLWMRIVNEANCSKIYSKSLILTSIFILLISFQKKFEQIFTFFSISIIFFQNIYFLFPLLQFVSTCKYNPNIPPKVSENNKTVIYSHHHRWYRFCSVSFCFIKKRKISKKKK